MVVSAYRVFGGTWANADEDGSTPLADISFASTGPCVAVASDGHVVASTDPTGRASAWRLADIDGPWRIESTSCESATLWEPDPGPGR